MAYNKQYKDFLEISPNFESVVDIDADKRNQNLWREYIVGDDMENLVDVLCQSLGNEAPDARRSFWVHGSYGTGKSYAAIFVKHLLEEKPEVIDEFLSKSSRLSKYRNRFMKCRNKGDYLVIWKTGCTGIRTGDMMLVEAEQAVREALVAKFGDKADLGGASLISAVTDRLDDASINWDHVIENTILSDDYSSVEELRAAVSSGKLSAIQTTAMVLRDMKFGLISNLDTFENWLTEVIDANGLAKSGIFFIWDEFTEYVAHSDDHTIMQQLSEFCKVKPFFMLYVVHRSDEMVDSMGKDRYQMITNRFHTVEFHISASAALDLIAGSIVVRNGMQNAWADERNQVVNDFKKFLPDLVGLDDKTGEMIDKLCPIHPMTIRLLSRVAESFAAAQRTMFRFMKDQSNSDIGFVGYMDEMHLLLKEEQTAAYSVEIWKRFRKWGGIPTGLTQNVKDLLSSREVENIFENSDMIIMLNQAAGDRQILAKQLNISPHQLSYVTHSGEGEGLLFFGNVILPFVDRFPTDLELYRIMTTKLGEVSEGQK